MKETMEEIRTQDREQGLDLLWDFIEHQYEYQYRSPRPWWVIPTWFALGAAVIVFWTLVALRITR